MIWAGLSRPAILLFVFCDYPFDFSDFNDSDSLPQKNAFFRGMPCARVDRYRAPQPRPAIRGWLVARVCEAWCAAGRFNEAGFQLLNGHTWQYVCLAGMAGRRGEVGGTVSRHLRVSLRSTPTRCC